MKKYFLFIGRSLFLLFFLNLNGAWAQEAVPGEFLVLLKENQKPSVALNRLVHHSQDVMGLSIRLIKMPTHEQGMAANFIEKVKALPEVEIIEPNFIYNLEAMGGDSTGGEVLPNDPEFKKAWGLRNSGQADGWGLVGRPGVDAGVAKGWALQRGSKAITVAVIDSGLNYRHPEIRDNLWINVLEQRGQAGVDDDKNGFVDDIYGYDFVNSDSDPMDDHGHGTLVSSIIGAKGNNQLAMVGINWDVSLMPIKFASSEGKGTLELGLKAIQYATLMGARIINNSWGGSGYSEILHRVVEEANQKNILFVAAAGNSGTDNGESPIFPASLPNANVLSVAAYDQHGQLWNGSCYGAQTVHLGAPGVSVSGLWGDGYRSMTGTSLAAPHVSGIAALVLAQEPHLSVVQLKDRLLQTARPMANLVGKTITGASVDAFYALSNQKPPESEDDPRLWINKKDVRISSAHPYQNATKQEWIIDIQGAKEISLFFEAFEMERKVDHVDLHDRDGRLLYVLTGKTGRGWSPIVRGDYVKVVLVSDSANNLYGFDLTQAAFR